MLIRQIIFCQQIVNYFIKKLLNRTNTIISHLTYISEVPFKQQVIYFNFDVHQLVQIKLGVGGRTRTI